MSRIILFIIAATSILTSLYIFFAPQAFYDGTPGVSVMGPFNIHFIRDVGLAFLASGLAVGWGALKYNRAVAISGAAWPFLHALFHLQIWGARGFPFDEMFIFNFFAVIFPAIIAMWAALVLKSKT